MKKQLHPNFTQIPNIFLDSDIAELSGGEFKILMFICRRTYGFGKLQDRISLSQFTDGIKTADGKILCKGCGLGKTQVIKSLKKLEEMGRIRSEKSTNKTTFYSLEIDEKENLASSQSEQDIHQTSSESEQVCNTQLVHKVNSTCSESEPQLVQKVNTQKKHKINITKEKEKNIKKRKRLTEVFGEFENVFLTAEEYKKLCEEKLNQEITNSLIFDLSAYIEKQGKDKYKNHYATILTWAKNKIIKKAEQAQTNSKQIV